MSIDNSTYIDDLRCKLLYSWTGPLNQLSLKISVSCDRDADEITKTQATLMALIKFIEENHPTRVSYAGLNSTQVLKLFDEALLRAVKSAAFNALAHIHALTAEENSLKLLDSSLEWDQMGHPKTYLFSYIYQKMELLKKIVKEKLGIQEIKETREDRLAKKYIRKYTSEDQKEDVVILESPQTIKALTIKLLEQWRNDPSLLFKPPLQDAKTELQLDEWRNVLAKVVF